MAEDEDEATWDDVEAFARGLGDEFRIMWATKDPPDEAMITAAETLADLVDDEDALARLHVDGVEVQIGVSEPLDGPGVTFDVGVLGDPRELPAGAAAHAAFERAFADRGPILRIERNWERWKT
jgi:hypothetical protein